MTVPVWTPGTLKIIGDLVKPASTGAVSNTTIENANFDDGDVEWDKEYGWTIITGGHKYNGTHSAQYDPDPLPGPNVHFIEQTESADVAPGQSVTASCFVDQGASSSGTAGASVVLRWYAADDTTLISTSEGNRITSSDGGWKKSTVTANCPAGAAKVRVGARGFRNSGGNALWVDAFSWNLVAQAAPTGLIYKAVAVTTGLTGTAEPTWPATLGVQVVDAGVTWEAVNANRVTWEAEPLMRTGSTEPEWPTAPGLYVPDNTVNWETIGATIQDENCPHTPVVAMVASHVFAANGDIVRFCATKNPLDWTTEGDAGFLGTGLQQQNANDAAVLNLYRANLVCFNAECFQLWQMDPDPALMQLLDQKQGIGTTHQFAAVPVVDELFFLSQRGVRTVSNSIGGENLRSGDVGEPVDSLVMASLAITEGLGRRPVGTYYPGAGQYWLAFPLGNGNSTVYVFTRNGQRGAWSRYEFPFLIRGFAQLDNTLYIRGEDEVYRVDESLTFDEVASGELPVTGFVWWPHLDFGRPGVNKQLEAFDLVAEGEDVSVSVGYVQGRFDGATFTPYYNLTAADTVPGTVVPMPLCAPSLSVKVRFGGGPWSLKSLLLYLTDEQPAA